MNHHSLISFTRVATLTAATSALLVSPAFAVERLWNVASPTEADFNTGSNWNPTFVGAFPTADGASIANGGTAVISGNASLVQLVVGGFQTGTNTGTGTLKQTAGVVTLSDGLVVGRQGTSNGTYTMTGGSLTGFNLRVGGGSATSVGNVTISGAGTVFTTTQNGTAGVVGIGVPGTGTVTLSNSAAWNHTGSTVLEVGGDNNSINANGGNGTLNINSSATVTLTTADMAIGRNNASIGTVTVNGGSLTLSGATASINVGTVFANNGTTSAGTGTLTLTSGTVTANRINVATNTNGLANSGTGTVNFDGGTAVIGGMTKGSGTGNVHFNGTTIQASAANANFFSGFTSAGLDIKAGGLIFDTNGNAVTITQGTTSGVGIVGGLTKKGAGTLKLSGVNGYTGGTTIEAGALQLGVSNAIAAASNLTLSTGTLDLNGFNESMGTLGLTASSTVDFGSVIGANSLTFVDSSAVSWTGSLTLVNFDVLNDTLSFSSQTGLTLGQLSAISVAGYQATGLSPSGVVQFTAVPEPSQYAAGIAGLLVVIAILRRRRLAV